MWVKLVWVKVGVWDSHLRVIYIRFSSRISLSWLQVLLKTFPYLRHIVHVYEYEYNIIKPMTTYQLVWMHKHAWLPITYFIATCPSICLSIYRFYYHHQWSNIAYCTESETFIHIICGELRIDSMFNSTFYYWS